MKFGFALPLLLLDVTGQVGIAQSAGVFTATGRLTTRREFHTATLLTNGKVLVTGGGSDSGDLATAELYDSATGTFTVTSSMTTARANHTATLLPDGRVLMAGGNPLLSTAELYDPSTETFSSTGPMFTPRILHTATLLSTGKVLIVGGYNPASGISAGFSAEIYDPLTGIFTVTGGMSAARIGHTATLLASGKVLIDGGRVSGANPAAELYDPTTGVFSLTGSSAYGDDLYPFTASLLPNGRVLETLAYTWDPSAFAEEYDPTTGAFTQTGQMSSERFYSTATLLPEGRVMIADFASAEIFDPAVSGFNAPLPLQSQGFVATLLSDGTVLVAGGCCGVLSNTASIYRPSVAMPTPVLLSVSAGGEGAILHASSHQLVSPVNPAVDGEALEVYLTGLAEGSVIPPQVAIGGRLAEVLFFGQAPGYTGLNQVNIRVPPGLASGPAVPLRLNYLARPSNEVTISVQ